MSCRTVLLLAVSVVASVASTAAISADAVAKKAVRHPVAVAVVPPPPPVPVAIIDNNYGPVATRIPRCFDSPILYPYPPCY